MKDKDIKGKDKLKHFLVCFSMAVISPLVATGAALGKEYGDCCASGNHWCWWDLMYDTVGILAGSILHYVALFLITGNWF